MTIKTKAPKNFLQSKAWWIYGGLLILFAVITPGTDDPNYSENLSALCGAYMIFGAIGTVVFRRMEFKPSKPSTKDFRTREPLQLAKGLKQLNIDSTSDDIYALFGMCECSGDWQPIIEQISNDLILHGKVQQDTIISLTISK